MEKDNSSTKLKKCSSLNNLQPVPMGSQPVAQSTTSAPRGDLSLSLLTPRTRRFSCNGSNGVHTSNGLISPGPRLAPRISQLRQEECVDTNAREFNHEREVHSALSISQSYEDLTLVMNDSWSFKNAEELTNPLHVSLPTSNNCSSPSPTSSRHLRLQYGMSPSPTRRTFATRRSMSPIAIRPSPLGSVKRKFDMMDDGNSCSSTSSSQPFKRIFTESRGSSPVMSPICPSPDSSTTNSDYNGGRSTPKMFLTKVFNSNSVTSSPLSTVSLDNDQPSPLCGNQIISKEQENNLMDIGSSASDSGVDACSEVSSVSELVTSSECGSDDCKKRASPNHQMIVEDMQPSTSAIIPMNIDKTL